MIELLVEALNKMLLFRQKFVTMALKNNYVTELMRLPVSVSNSL